MFEMLPLVGVCLSILSRIIFMYLIYVNKSKNSISLLFSIVSIISGSVWLIVFVETNSQMLIIRTTIELLTSLFSSLYIIKNKLD